jgi:hypothetical protein
MNNIIKMTLVVLMAACGNIVKKKDPRTFHGVDPVFTPYTQRFEKDLGRSIGEVSVSFGELSSDKAGICIKYDSGHREVVINANEWNSGRMTEWGKFNLIYHELGHCVLGREHTEEKIEYDTASGTRTAPKSFMYPRVFYTESMGPLEGHYVDELMSGHR